MSAVAWQAPGRVNLIGEHTDYNDGYVLPFALPQVTRVSAAPSSGPVWTVTSAGETASFGVDDLHPGKVTGWPSYVAGIVWVLRNQGIAVPGARLEISSDVPQGAGLSSSAALECAVLAALCDLADAQLADRDRVRLAQRAENEFVGVPCGIMDQSAATLCRGGHALFLDCRTLAVEHIPFDVAAQGLSVLVINTNAPHRLVDSEYADRRAVCEAAARELGVAALRDIGPDAPLTALDPVVARRVRHVVTENARVLSTVDTLRGGDIAAIGPLLTASHASLRDDFEVTVPELDTAVEAALAAGAYGARMTGGGFGGCVLALVSTERVSQVAGAVADAFARAGFAAPDSFPATPSPGARRAPAP